MVGATRLATALSTEGRRPARRWAFVLVVVVMAWARSTGTPEEAHTCSCVKCSEGGGICA
jgi:hypothetical protein